MIRQIPNSQEAAYQAAQSPAKIVKVYSMFPVDRADCPCAKVIQEWQLRLGKATQAERQQLIEEHPFIICPRDKSKMRRYEVICSKCNQRQGYLWATTPTLEDWCDFHYVQWTPGDYWRGCFTPHISPVTEELCFECCCGNDTRDFRANMTLPAVIANQHEARNRYGRKFGRKESKFFVRLVK